MAAQLDDLVLLVFTCPWLMCEREKVLGQFEHVKLLSRILEHFQKLHIPLN